MPASNDGIVSHTELGEAIALRKMGEPDLVGYKCYVKPDAAIVSLGPTTTRVSIFASSLSSNYKGTTAHDTPRRDRMGPRQTNSF